MHSICGVVARWITRLQPFEFKIVHQPGKHHSHADGSCRTSRPCKRESCPECDTLQNWVTRKGEIAHAVSMGKHYVEHYDGYIELVDDSALFRYAQVTVVSTADPAISSKLMWYLVRYPIEDDQPTGTSTDVSKDTEVQPTVSRAKTIKKLLETDPRQSQTQTEPVKHVKEVFDHVDKDKQCSMVGLAAFEEELPFPEAEAELCDIVRATDECVNVSPALQALIMLIDLSDLEIVRCRIQICSSSWTCHSPERPALE